MDWKQGKEEMRIWREKKWEQNDSDTKRNLSQEEEESRLNKNAGTYKN